MFESFGCSVALVWAPPEKSLEKVDSISVEAALKLIPQFRNALKIHDVRGLKVELSHGGPGVEELLGRLAELLNEFSKIVDGGVPLDKVSKGN